MEGYIWVHRKILDNPVVMKDAEHFTVWCYLLLNASHTGYPVIFNGEKIMLQAGQLITGRKKIAEVTKVNESKVRRILNNFKNDHQIDQLISPRNSLITILNWDKYQYSDQLNGQQLTNNWPTTDQQLATNNNVNNVKKVKKGKKPSVNSQNSRIIDYKTLEEKWVNKGI